MHLRVVQSPWVPVIFPFFLLPRRHSTHASGFWGQVTKGLVGGCLVFVIGFSDTPGVFHFLLPKIQTLLFSPVSGVSTFGG